MPPLYRLGMDVYSGSNEELLYHFKDFIREELTGE